MAIKIKKAVIPIAGLGTRFLPLSKVLSKELWPLVDKPVIQYILEEAEASGIKEIIFVGKPGENEILNYFKAAPELEKVLKERKKRGMLKTLKDLENFSKKLSFSQVHQKKPLGAANAVFLAKRLVGSEPAAIMWDDDIVESKKPCLLQLIEIFNKFQKPVIALCKVPDSSIPNYGIVKVKKVGKRLFKITGITEKPSLSDAPSNLAIVGKYIITPEVFNYLSKTFFSLSADISLTDTLSLMVEKGSEIYGYEFEGKWLECGNKLDYLKSNLYLSLKHPQFGKELIKSLKIN